MKIVHAVIGIAPAPLLAWLGALTGLWSNTGIVHPHWRTQADATAIALALVLSLVAWSVVAIRPRWAFRTAFACFGLFLVALIGTIVLKVLTRDALTVADIELHKGLWHAAYVITVAAFAQTVAAFFAALIRHAGGSS